jgi:hypothetical protein
VEQVKSRLVRSIAQGLYRWWGVCSPDDWTKMVKQAQAMVNACEVTWPVPVMNLHETRPDLEWPDGNPVEIEPVYLYRQVTNAARYAGRVAQILSQAGHVVFYLTNTSVPSSAAAAQYSEVKQLVTDIIMSAPVVVYYDNEPGRESWIRELFMNRQCGILVKVVGDQAAGKGGSRGKF